MVAELPVFTKDSGLYSLNVVFDFPEDKRQVVLQVLTENLEMFPTSDHLWASKEVGSYAEWDVERKHMRLLDKFTQVLDPEMAQSGQWLASPEVVRMRLMFFEMIVKLSREQVTNGLQQLAKSENNK